MKKLGIGVLGFGVLVVLGWGVFWFIGKGRVDARIDAEIAALQQQGWTVTIGTRETGGFPHRYRVGLADIGLVYAADGSLIRVPALQADASVFGGPAKVILPEGMSFRLPFGEALRIGDPSLPEFLRLSVEVDGLELNAPDGALFVADAEAVRVGMDQDDYHGSFQLVAEAVTASGGMGEADKTGELRAATLRFDVQSEPPDSAPMTVQLTGSDMSLRGRYAPPWGDLLARLASDVANDHAELDYRFAGLDVEIFADGSASGGFKGRLGIAGEQAVGRVEAADGQIRLDAQSENVSWSLAPEGGGVSLAGAISVAFAKMAQVLPLQASEDAVDAQTRLVLDGIVPDETLWQSLDPRGVLARGPASISLDAVARTKVRQSQQPGNRPPQIRYEPTNLSLEALSLAALGATLSAGGDVDILQPIMVPLGEVAVEATGIVALLGDLEEAGLITTEQREMGDAILQVYARPAAGSDRWVTAIGFGTEGISVNGLPVQ